MPLMPSANSSSKIECSTFGNYLPNYMITTMKKCVILNLIIIFEYLSMLGSMVQLRSTREGVIIHRCAVLSIPAKVIVNSFYLKLVPIGRCLVLIFGVWENTYVTILR